MNNFVFIQDFEILLFLWFSMMLYAGLEMSDGHTAITVDAFLNSSNFHGNLHNLRPQKACQFYAGAANVY